MKGKHMMKYVSVAATLVMLLATTQVNAQLGKKLRERTKKVSTALNNPTEFVREEGVNYLKNSKAKFDSASFGYAISLSDNAGLFENKETMSNVRDGAIMFLDRKEEKEPIEVANNYKDMGEMSFAANEYRLAEASFLTSQLVFESNDLQSHVNYAGVIADLGLVYHTMGRHEKAMEPTQQALELRKEAFGENSLAYAASLNNFAVLQKDMGHFGTAEELLSEAISTSEQLEPGVSHAILLNNQALLNQQLGRFNEAEAGLKKSLEISSSFQGTKSTNHQRLMTNLAILYQEMGRYTEAEEIFLEVISLKEKRLGTRHPDYAHMLSNLAALYVLMEKDDQVEELLLQAQGIYERKFGSAHPSYATNQANLGNFYRYKGRLDEAETLHRQCLATRAASLGEKHPAYAQSMEDLAMVLWAKEEWEESNELFEGAMQKSLDFVESFFPAMSEEEKTRYWERLQPRFFKYYAYAVESAHQNAQAPGRLLHYRSITKGLLLNTSSKVRNAILGSGDPDLIQAYDDWVDTKELLAAYYTYSKQEIQEQKVNMDSLERVANEKERYLSSNAPVFDAGFIRDQHDLAAIQEALAPEEALVEIVQVPIFDRAQTSVNEYYALVITKDQATPSLIDLGSSELLDDRHFKFYKNAIRLKKADPHSYDVFWKPLEAALGSKRKIYLSADGIYNQIPVTTLQSEGSFVIDRWEIHNVTKATDVVEVKSRKAQDIPNSLWLLGAPEYGGNGDITPLPGTKEEVQGVKQNADRSGYATQLLLGTDASETNVKTSEPKAIMHFATHGYFLEDVEGLSQQRVFGIQPEVAVDKPLLRAGLLLTGAGETFQGMDRKEISNQDNGVLTAYEALNLPLDDTELVVLSACETGLGDVKAGEGVYGLQRALLIAGANRVIMSLWKVSDEATRDLMLGFYKNMAESNNDVGASFRKTQLTLKEKYSDPYYWGAFVLIEK